MSDIVTKAKQMIESEAIDEIIEARRVQATDKATQAGFDAALAGIMTTKRPRLQMDGKNAQCQSCGQPITATPEPQPGGLNPPQPAQQQPGMEQQQPSQAFDVGGLMQQLEGLPEEALLQLQQALAKKLEAKPSRVDIPKEIPFGQ